MKNITEKEILIQTAIGSLGEEYRNNLCRYQTPAISKGTRTCNLCGLKCIHKGEEFYLATMGRSSYGSNITLNICKSCSWLPIQTINKIVDNHNKSK